MEIFEKHEPDMKYDDNETEKDIPMVVDDTEYLDDSEYEEYEDCVCRELREMGLGKLHHPS